MRETLFIVVKASAGELHVALPIAYFLRKNRELDVFFVFPSRDDKEALQLPDSYSYLLDELGETIYGYGGVWAAWRKNRAAFRNALIMTCDNGSVNIVDILHFLCRRSLILFFHHAYALHGNGSDLPPIRGRYQKGSVMLLNSYVDECYYKKAGFSSDALMLVGAPGYSREWIDRLNSEVVKADDFDRVVFVPLRAAHKVYLDAESYGYLVDSLARVFEKFNKTLFLVKFHPRQNKVKELASRLSRFNNVKVVYCSTFEAARASDLTISFWSSAITDSVACGTPAIEFHRHTVAHDQLISKSGGLISLYRDFELCEFFSDFDDLVVFIENLNARKLATMQEGQCSRLRQIYGLDGAWEKALNETFGQLYLRVFRRSIFSAYRVYSLSRLVRQLLSRLLVKR